MTRRSFAQIRLPAVLLGLVAVSFLAALAAPAPAAAGLCPRTTSSADLAWTMSLEPGCGSVPYENRAGRTIWAVTHDGTRFIGAGTTTTVLDPEGPAVLPPPVALQSVDGLDLDRDAVADPTGTVLVPGPSRAASTSRSEARRSPWSAPAWPRPRATARRGRSGRRPRPLSFVTDVAAGSSRWIAVGHAAPPNMPVDLGAAAVWSSTDGRTWARTKTYAAFCPEGIAARSSRFVAVGSDCARRTPRAVVIVSADNGLHWTRVRLPAGAGALHDVVQWRAGFLAAGDAVSAAGRSGVAIWHSPDGRAWRRVAFFTERRTGEEIVKLAVTSDGVVAIAEQGTLTDGLSPTAFFSTTGTSGWHRVGRPAEPGLRLGGRRPDRGRGRRRPARGGGRLVQRPGSGQLHARRGSLPGPGPPLTAGAGSGRRAPVVRSRGRPPHRRLPPGGPRAAASRRRRPVAGTATP